MGYLYLLIEQNNCSFKIGVSVYPYKRASKLDHEIDFEKSRQYPMTTGKAYKIERNLHYLFRHKNVEMPKKDGYTEWFCMSVYDDVKKYLKDHCKLLGIGSPEPIVLTKTTDIDAAFVELPVFSLRAGDKNVRKYEHNGNTLEVIPSVLGLATMHDKDVLLYCIGQVVEAINRGCIPSRTVRITAHDLLVTTNRGTGKTDYERLRDSLSRLVGTTLRVSTTTSDYLINDNLGLIEDAQIVCASTGRMTHIDVTLSEWTYSEAIALEVLSYNPEYFQIRSGLERRLYELILYSLTGKRPQARWTLSLELLHKKAGAGGALKNFRHAIKQLSESDHLLDYCVHFDAGTDLVSFYKKSKIGISSSRPIISVV